MKHVERFTDRARDYALGRPSYADDAISALLNGLGDPSRLTIIDLGAGTGIASRQLAGRGAHVIAVEPNAAMRDSATSFANLVFVDGTAEATGLPSSAARLVTAFQAFHWFDHTAALREISRILLPGGRAAVVFNERHDEGDAFTAAYSRITERFTISNRQPSLRDGLALFENYSGWVRVSALEFESVRRLDRAGLIARAASVSYLPHDGIPAAELLEELNGIFDVYSQDGTIEMQMRTIVTIGEAA